MNKKAVSSIFAAVILIAITVVSVVLVTSLFLSRFNESANQCKLLVLSFNLFADIHGEHPLITFTVKNIGTEQINNIDLVVNGEPVIPFNLTSPMNAGDTRAFQTELNDAFAIGDYYSYTIRASTPKGSSCVVANTVLCDWYSGEVSGQTYVLTIINPPNGAFNLAAGTHTYNSGTVVGVQAALGAGYMFDHWVLDGSDAGTSNPLQITMNRDHTVTASFQASGITEGDYSSWTHSWESTEFGEASPTYVSQVIIDEVQGTMCVQWNYGTFTVYSLTNGAVLASGPSEAYDWIAGPYRSAGGKYYLTITYDNYVEVRSGARLLQMIFSSDWNCIAISPGGRYVVLITRWPSVRVDVFEGVATGQAPSSVVEGSFSSWAQSWESTEVGDGASPGWVEQVIFDEGQGTVFVLWSSDTFTVYSLTNGSVLASGSSNVYDWIAGPYQSIGGKYYLTITPDYFVEVRSGARLLRTIASSDWDGIAISPGGRYVVLIMRRYVYVSVSITVDVFEGVETGQSPSRVVEGDYSYWEQHWESTEFGEASPTYVSQVIIDEVQGTMCVQWNYGTFTVYSLTNGAVLASGPSEAYDWIAGPYQSVGGKYYLTITNDGYVEVRSGARLLQMIFSSDWNCIAISPGGRYVVLITRWPSVRVDVFEGVATEPLEVTVKFSTLSLLTSNLGTIKVDASDIGILPQAIILSRDSHSVEFVPPTGYSFDHWDVIGGVAMVDPNANPTSITVTGDGIVTAVFVTSTATVTFSSQTLASEQIVNGGFEDDFAHWVPSGGIPATISTTTVHSGVKSCVLGDIVDTWSVHHYTYMTQTFDPVPVNGLTKAEFYYLGDSPTYETLQVLVQYTDGTWQFYSGWVYSGWNQFNLMGLLDNNKILNVITIWFACPDTSRWTYYYVWIDDVSFVGTASAPSNLGTIRVDASDIGILPQAIILNVDSHSIEFVPSIGYSFDHWEVTGVAVDDPNANPTSITVTGDGTVTAVFTAVPYSAPPSWDLFGEEWNNLSAWSPIWSWDGIEISPPGNLHVSPRIGIKGVYRGFSQLPAEYTIEFTMTVNNWTYSGSYIEFYWCDVNYAYNVQFTPDGLYYSTAVSYFNGLAPVNLTDGAQHTWRFVVRSGQVDIFMDGTFITRCFPTCAVTTGSDSVIYFYSENDCGQSIIDTADFSSDYLRIASGNYPYYP